MIWLPQQQQEKKRQAMIDALKKNDKVVTTGGIYGTVVSVDPDQRQGGASRRRRQGSEAHHDPVERGAGARGVVGEGRRTPTPEPVCTPVGRGRPIGRRAGGSRSTFASPPRGGSGAIATERTIADSAGCRPRSNLNSSILRCRPQDAVGRCTPGLRNDHETVSLENRLDHRVGRSSGLLAMVPPDKKLKLGIDLSGGTILVYEVAQENLPANFNMDELISALKQRADPRASRRSRSARSAATGSRSSCPRPATRRSRKSRRC